MKLRKETTEILDVFKKMYVMSWDDRKKLARQINIILNRAEAIRKGAEHETK